MASLVAMSIPGGSRGMMMDVTKMDSEDLNVSPYLRRPVRSLADVMQGRAAGARDTTRETPDNVLIFKPRPRRPGDHGDARGPLSS